MVTTSAERAEAAGTGGGDERAPSVGRWSWVPAVLVPTVVLVVHAARYGSWIVDDAGITFAYARSLTSGAGLVNQPGALPVEGYSNPLWLGLLALGRLLGLFDRGTWFGTPDLVAFPKFLALVCCVGVFACFFAVARRVSSRPVAVTAVAGSVTACVPSFVIWCFSGLENPLYALLVVGLAGVLVVALLDDTLATPRTATVCALLAAGAVLTRPDGLIYTVAYPLALVVTRRDELRAHGHVVARYVAVVALPTLAYLVLRLAVFGDWLPNTARAKVQETPSLAELNRPALLITYGGWLLAAVVAVSIVAVLVRGRSPLRVAVCALLLPLGLALLAFAVLDADWMPQARFATPVWPLVALVGSLAVAQELDRLPVRPRAAAGAAVVLALAVSVAGWVDYDRTMRQYPTAPVCHIARVTGMLINSYADRLGIEEGSLLGIDAGGTSLTSRLRFVDYAGLTDATIGRFRAEGDAEGLRDYIFEVARPTFTRIGDAFTGEQDSEVLRDPRLLRDYVPIEPASSRLFVAVRREAVTDPSRLAEVRAFAARAAPAASASYNDEDERLGWSCGSVLRPAPFSP